MFLGYNWYMVYNTFFIIIIDESHKLLETHFSSAIFVLLLVEGETMIILKKSPF